MSPAAARRRTPAEGGRGRLSRQQVVDAAVDLAGREGLEALSLRKLAVELGVTPMALYWHVADKEALLDALGECLFAGVEVPAPVEDWYEDLSGVVQAIVARLRQHPALAPLALRTVMANEPGALLAERVLSRLSEAGLPDGDAANVGAFLLGAVATLVAELPGAAPGEAAALEERLGRKSAHLQSLPAEHFPSVRRMAPMLLDCADPDRYLALGTELLMVGVRGLAEGAPG